MFTPYHNLPGNARVWIYQSDRAFTQQEVAFISEKTTEFINQWTKHGDNLKGSFTIKHQQFLILAVDESFNNVSGCSIDSSVRFVQQLEQELKLDLMNKLNVSFKDGNNINIVTLAEFKNFAQQAKIKPDTIVFNNLLETKTALENEWEVPAKQSWHQRFFV